MRTQDSPRRGVLSAAAGTLGVSVAAGVLVTVMVAPAIALTGVTANSTLGIFEGLPEYIDLDLGAQQNTIVAINPDGSELQVATIYEQNREEVGIDLISEHLQCAAIAGEDRRFRQHGGVDVPSVLRAVLGPVIGRSGTGGGSTLTMQLVRNILQQQAVNDRSLSDADRERLILEATEPTLDRKLREMKLAIGLEKAYTKDEILAAYLNIANFGGNTYGVQAAAEQYFSKPASEVTVAEAASLVAIVQEPAERNLVPENFESNEDRRDVILGWMAKEGCITDAERDEALAIPVDEAFINPSPATVGCLNALPKFEFVCDYAELVVPELEALGSTTEEREAAWDRGGYKLVLTVNPELQNIAWDTVNQWAPNNETRFQLGAASSSVQAGTGHILAMAQNKDFDNRSAEEIAGDPTVTSVNFAADFAHGGSIGFQPGSTYKPYVLLAYLDAGNGVRESFNASRLEVSQSAFADSCPPQPDGPPWGGSYKFRNDEGERGSYDVMRGTARSVNSVFVQMAMRVDQCDIREIAESIGIHNADGSELSTRPSCSIGGCENALDPTTQAAAYAAIANGGVYCAPILIRSVVAPDGAELPGQDPHCGPSLVTPEVAATASYAMAGVMSGTASASRPRDGTPYIGKTGTTDESVHTWMVGSSTSVATAVWVGNIEGEQALRTIKVNGTQASVLRHRIFRPIAEAVNARYPGGAFPAPDPSLMNGTPTRVPSLDGLTLDQAANALELAELGFVDGGQVDSDRPAGTVVGSTPSGGASVPRGTPVTVVTSNGQGATVPDVTGDPQAAAVAAVQGAGFADVSSRCVDAADLGIADPSALPPVGTVTSQDPPGGTMANRSRRVELAVFQLLC